MSDLNQIPSFTEKQLDQPNREFCVSVPQVIRDLPAENPSRQPLANDEAKVAIPTLRSHDFVSLEFPRTMKLHTDPTLNGQNVCVVSFIPSKGATPDGDGCYGLMKVRGTFDSVEKADKYSEFLIRDHDSYTLYDIAWVGKPFPLMKDNRLYCVQTREVDIRTKINNVMKDDLKEKKEIEKQQMNEIQKRHKELVRDVNEEKEETVDFDDLEFYVQMRAKKANLLYRQDDLNVRLKETREQLGKLSQELVELDKKHPEFKDQYLEKFRTALSASGISEVANPIMKYMKE